MDDRTKQIDASLAEGGFGVTLGSEDACLVLRITRRTLTRLIGARRIQTARVSPAGSSKLIIRRRELARFLAELEQ